MSHSRRDGWVFQRTLKDSAGNPGAVAAQLITIELSSVDLDHDGAPNEFEQDKDGNKDGIDDSTQHSVTTFQATDGSAATIAVKVLEKTSTPDPSTGGSLTATTSIFFSGISANAETTTGTTISGLQNIINQNPGNSSLAAGAKAILAVSDQPSFRIVPEIIRTGTVEASQEANFRKAVTERFSNTIQEVDLFFANGPQAWNALFKRNGDGSTFFFGYNPKTGLGGILLDRNDDGAVDGARLFLKDGELGDQDGQPNGAIQDPVGLASLVTTPTLRLSEDGLRLTVDGVAGTGLWLNIEVLSAAADWQNTLQLVTTDGTELGSIGATSNSPNLATKELYLQAGQELRFVQNSRNNSPISTPAIRSVAENNGFRLRLDDGGSVDRDYNDLEVRITSALTARDPNAIAMARLQHNNADPLIDLSAIPAAGATLNFNILTDSAYINRFGLVKLTGDAVTGYSVAGVAATNTAAFHSAVHDNLINPGGSAVTAGGQTPRTIRWDVTAADAGLYAAVLINPNGEVFTFGMTASDGQQHVKVLGNSDFGFEDLLASQGSDWDFNDFRVQVSFA